MSTSTRARSALHLAERNYVGWRKQWWVLLSGVVEPVLYLLGIGVGVGALVGTIEIDGRLVEYAQFVAPGMLAASAMNGALYDTTFNFFFKLKYNRLYESVLYSPLGLTDIVVGEMGWAVARGGSYSVFFMVIMVLLGMVESWWFVLALPAALLIGWAFASLGSWITTYVRHWTDFDLMSLFIQPLFLASTTFFPLAVYPDWAEPIVVATPLYHGVDLVRDLTLGTVGVSNLVNVGYLLALAVVTGVLTSRRLRVHLLS